MNKYKIAFWIIWLTLVFFGVYTVSKNVIFSTLFSNYSLTLNFLQRISGVLVFILLFIQIILGAYMPRLTNLLGGLAYKVHTIQGPIIYLFALIHPLFLLLLNYKIFHTLDPFYVYTQVCFLCKTNGEFMFSLGRMGLWFLTIGVFAALLRNSEGWFRKNWRKLHILNYIVFFLVAVHGYFVGSDFRIFPLNYFFFISLIVVFSTVVLKLAKKI